MSRQDVLRGLFSIKVIIYDNTLRQICHSACNIEIRRSCKFVNETTTKTYKKS